MEQIMCVAKGGVSQLETTENDIMFRQESTSLIQDLVKIGSNFYQLGKSELPISWIGRLILTKRVT